MRKITMFSKAWWVTVLVLFVSVTLLFPYPVQADPGTIEPPKKRTTMFAEIGYFNARKAYTVLLEIHHTQKVSIVHIGSSLSWLPVIGKGDHHEVSYLHKPVWTHDRCNRHDKVLVTGMLFRGHVSMHPWWRQEIGDDFGDDIGEILIDGGEILTKSAALKVISNVLTVFELASIIGQYGNYDVLATDEIYVDIEKEGLSDDWDLAQTMKFEPRKKVPGGYSLTYYGSLMLSSENEEVEDTTGLCTPECLDSDGNNITEYGLVKGIDPTGEYEYLDTCLGKEVVKEWTCDENNLPSSEDVDCPPDYHCSTYLGMGRCSDIGDELDEIIKCSENDLILFEGTWEDGLIGFKYPPGSVICSPEDDCPEGSTCDFEVCFCLPDGGWDEILKGGELSEPLPTTEAPTPTPESPTATPEPEDESISVGQLIGGHECGTQCKQIGMVYIKTNRSVPAANATVTIRMTGPGGTDEITSTITGPDGIAEFSFPANSHEDYTLTVENVEAEGLIYDPAQNQLSSVVVGTTPQPLPERAALPVSEFLLPFVDAMRSGDTKFLLERLHPAVIEIYGSKQCLAYLESVSDPSFEIEVLNASGPAPWEWVIDDISTSIPDSYAVNINLTSRGTTSILESHFALDDQNRMSWFTDCGDPQN